MIDKANGVETTERQKISTQSHIVAKALFNRTAGKFGEKFQCGAFVADLYDFVLVLAKQKPKLFVLSGQNTIEKAKKKVLF